MANGPGKSLGNCRWLEREGEKKKKVSQDLYSVFGAVHYKITKTVFTKKACEAKGQLGTARESLQQH